MSSYPSAVATFREKTNLPGVTFVDPDKATIYADDLIKIEGEIVAVETVLGTSPEGTAATVSERIADTESALDTKQPSLGFVPEDVTNKDTTATLGTSDTKYPSQKAVKTYVDNSLATHKSQSWRQVGTIFGPTFQNSWVNYDPVNLEGAGFLKDGHGFVHLHGLVKSGIVGTTIFTLPAGYRPRKLVSFICNSNSGVGTINVRNNGEVQAIVGSNEFFYLDNVIFLAEA